MYRKFFAIFLATLLLSACGGGNSGVDASGAVDTAGTETTGTGTAVDSGDSGIVTAPSVEDVANFVVADGISSYSGERGLAFLDNSIANEYVRMLYSPGLNAPGLASRGSASANGIQLAEADFLRSQETLLRRLKTLVLQWYRYQQRSVDFSDPASCQNQDGNIRLTGELYDSEGKGKLKMNYINCQTGGYVFNGDAYFLIYAINGSFNALSSTTLSYNSIQAQSIDSGEAVVMTGTVDEVEDFDTGSNRLTTKLHRLTASTGKQTLTDVLRQSQGLDGSVAKTGSLYEHILGRVQVRTLQRIIYNAADAPIAGQTLMTGFDNSSVRVTALGEQYNAVTDRHEILLLVEVDEDGDGRYESASQLDNNTL